WNIDGDGGRVGRRRVAPRTQARSHTGSGEGGTRWGDTAVRTRQWRGASRSQRGRERAPRRVRRDERGGAEYVGRRDPARRATGRDDHRVGAAGTARAVARQSRASARG